MEENKLAYRRSIIIGGILLAALLIIYFQLTTTFGNENGGLNFLMSVLFLLGTMIYSGKQYLKSAREPVFNYSKAFGFGVLVALLGSVLFTLYVYIFYEAIDPGAIQEMVIKMEEQMLQNKQNPDMIEQVSKAMEKYMTPFVLAMGSFIYYFLLGLVVSLFAAIFTRQKDSDNPFHRDMKTTNDE